MADPAVDTFANIYSGGLSSPVIHAFAITPDDDNDLGFVTRSLWVGGEGDLAVVMAGGETVTYVGVAAGTRLLLRVTRVLDTDTTATDLVGEY